MGGFIVLAVLMVVLAALVWWAWRSGNKRLDAMTDEQRDAEWWDQQW